MSLTKTGAGKISLSSSANQYLQGSTKIVYGRGPAGNTAAYFPGISGSYMLFNSSPSIFDLSTSNLFVECWIYLNSLSTQFQCIIANGPTGSGTSKECWILRINPSNAVDFIINAALPKTATSTTTLSTLTWYHIAASYNSGTSTGYVFINGGTPNSIASVTPTSSSGSVITIGAYPSPLSAIYMNGYIRDIRIIKGGTVPTAGFTYETSPWPYKSIPSYVSGGTNVFGLAAQYMSSFLFTKTLIPTGSGGTISTIDGKRIHTFTTISTSTFTVINGSLTCSVLIIAGGGGGGSGQNRAGGGGGAGGYVYYNSQTFNAGNYTITIGNGGNGNAFGNGDPGQDSSVTGLTTAVGGGYGEGWYSLAGSGGSGGGGGNDQNVGGTSTAGQGNNGGGGQYQTGGGGGGATSAGIDSTFGGNGGDGGNGYTSSISGISQIYSGGGGGGTQSGGIAGNGGTGGGGNGGAIAAGQDATYYGSGGGGGGSIDSGGFPSTYYKGGNGYQGIVIISYSV